MGGSKTNVELEAQFKEFQRACASLASSRGEDTDSVGEGESEVLPDKNIFDSNNARRMAVVAVAFT